MKLKKIYSGGYKYSWCLDAMMTLYIYITIIYLGVITVLYKTQHQKRNHLGQKNTLVDCIATLWHKEKQTFQYFSS